MRQRSERGARVTAEFLEQRARAAARRGRHKSAQRFLPRKPRRSRVQRAARLFLNAAVSIRRAVASTKPQVRFRRPIANNGGGCRAAKASWKSRGNASRNCRETSPRSLRAFRKTKGKSAPAASPGLVCDQALRQDSHATKRTAIPARNQRQQIRFGWLGQQLLMQNNRLPPCRRRGSNPHDLAITGF